MFSLYIPAMILLVVFTLWDVKYQTKNPPKKKHRSGRQKKDKQFRRAQKASNKRANRDFIVGGGIFGLLPTLVMGKIGHSLTTASDRYRYTISVPSLYHSVGRQSVSAVKEEVEPERHEVWLAWDQVRCDEAVASVAHRKAKEKDNWRKATTTWDALGGQPSFGCRSIARNNLVSIARMNWYKDGKDCDNKSSALVVDFGGDDSGDDDSDWTF